MSNFFSLKNLSTLLASLAISPPYWLAWHAAESDNCRQLNSNGYGGHNGVITKTEREEKIGCLANITGWLKTEKIRLELCIKIVRCTWTKNKKF